MSGFADSIMRNIVRVEKEIDAKLFSIYRELSSQVVYNCPVLRGNLINDFWPASNTYNRTVQTIVDDEGQSDIQTHSDVTGAGSISRIRDMEGLGTFRGQDGFLSFSTSVPYAYKIEYEGWSKLKAPAGFVRKALTEVAAKHR